MCELVCSHQDCTDIPKFVKPNIGKFCQKHIVDGAKKIKYIYCHNKLCTSIAIFGVRKKEYCKKHRTNDMKNFSNNKCQHNDCIEEASYNFKGIKPAKYCVKHIEVGMVYVKYQYCKVDRCIERAYYSVDGKKPTHCIIHKDNDKMMLVHGSRCVVCGKCAAFGIEGSKPTHCFDHKTNDMISLTKKICIVEGCPEAAYYNEKGKTPEYCIKHKSTIMVISRKQLCKYTGCEQSPSYNFPNETRPLFCETHIQPGMINIHSKKCSYEGCTTQPTFGLEPKKALRCKEHIENGMFDVYHKKCEYNECILRATCGHINNIEKFCKKHMENGMVVLQELKLKCDNVECTSRSKYGKPGSKQIKCFRHREAGMIRRSNGKCKKCRMPAIYGVDYIPMHCESHKFDEEINLVEQACSGCGLVMILDSNNKCEYCNPEMFKRAALAKQNKLMDYLDSVGLQGNSTDKIIDGGICGLERPDRVYDFGDKIIILECDEEQHRNRNCTCEQTRMVNIGQTFGGVPVYFIRFNPDDYLPLNDKNPENIKARYKLLETLLKKIKDNKYKKLPKALVSAIYLYFDDWDGFNNEHWKILSKFEEYNKE